MGVVLAFVVGYLVGARAGQQGFDDLATSARAVRESEEFRALLGAARSHLSSTFGELSRLVSEEGRPSASVEGVLGRVRRLFEEPTSGASAGTRPGQEGP
jgi:hypothetical protein